MFSVCTLLYGDNAALAARCLNSIYSTEGLASVTDIRIGMNRVCAETRDLVEAFATNWVRAKPESKVIVYDAQQQFKYPMMRRMFHDPHEPLADHTVWLDDDSYIDDPWKFWSGLCNLGGPHMEAHGYVAGQIWSLYIPEKRQRWFRDQPWYSSSGRHETIKFAQGAFWMAPTGLIKRLNWPIPELKHCGGDSLLGEIMHHKQIPLWGFSSGIRINADEHGNHSKSKRRGYTERELGYNYNGKPLPTDHQEFECEVTRYVYAGDGVRQGEGDGSIPRSPPVHV